MLSLRPACGSAQIFAADGQLTQLAGPQANTLLLYFVASDCPVSNRYFPEMERIAAEFAPAHIPARYVYANFGETAEQAGAHQRTYGAPVADATLDRSGTLARVAGASTTPEAAILMKNGSHWSTVWHGRIDDRYVRFGVERSQVQHHDLEDALRALIAHRALPYPEGPPVGCGIVSPAVIHAAGQ